MAIADRWKILLGWQIPVAFGILLLITFGAVWLIFGKYDRAIEDRAAARLANESTELGNRLRMTLQGLREDTLALQLQAQRTDDAALDKALAGALAPTSYPRAGRRANVSQLYLEAAILGEQGYLHPPVRRVGGKPVPIANAVVDPALAELLTAAKESAGKSPGQRVYLSAPVREPIAAGEKSAGATHRWVLWAIVLPQKPDDGAPTKAAAIKLNFDEAIREFATQPRLMTFVSDESGRCIVHPNKPLDADKSKFKLQGALANQSAVAARKNAKGQDPVDVYLTTAETRLDLGTNEAGDPPLENSVAGIPRFVLVCTLDEVTVNRFVRDKLKLPITSLNNDERRQKFAAAFDARLRELQLKSPASHLRFHPLAAADPWPTRYLISASDRAELAAVAAVVEDELWVSKQQFIDYQTFALHMEKVFLDPNRNDRFLNLATALSYDELRADIGKDVNPSLLLGYLAAACCLPLALMLWRLLHLQGAFRKMTVATSQVAAGNFDVDLPEERNDEIGELAQAFRQMARQIEERDSQLQEKAMRTQAIVSMAAEGIITFEDSQAIESFNPAARGMFGYALDDVKGRSLAILFAGGNQVTQAIDLAKSQLAHSSKVAAGLESLGLHTNDSWADMMAASISAKGIEALGLKAIDTFEFSPQMAHSPTTAMASRHALVGRRKDGSTFPVDVAVSKMMVNRRQLYTMIVRDVTEQKRAEAEILEHQQKLEQRVDERTAELRSTLEQLERARDSRDMFLASVSHDLRNPLAKVIGFAEVLAESELDEEQRADLQTIHSNGKRLLRLVKDILDYQKIVMGKLVLDLVEFELPALIDEIARGLQQDLQKRQSVLKLECDSPFPAMHSDRGRIDQLLANFLSNACKFAEPTATQPQATITLEASEDGENLRLAVTNTGKGLSSDQIARLKTFVPFNKVSHKSENTEGTGLGLAICKGICDALGGELEIDSVPGEHTTFSVRMPLRVFSTSPTRNAVSASATAASTGQNGPAAASDSQSPIARPRDPNLVLVIDDDAEVRDLMTRFLAGQGYRVLNADSGLRGIELAKQHQPAVITLDAMMPGLDGWGTLAALKNDAGTSDIPIIMVTMVDDRSRGFALGAADFVTKPVNWQQLTRVLQHYRQPSKPGSVLLVDDDEGLRNLASRILRAEGWTVIEADNGRTALDRLAESSPDLILLDLMMPVMDGFEFVEHLRSRQPPVDTPIIVITAKDVGAADRLRFNGRVAQVIYRGNLTTDEVFAEIQKQVAHHIHGGAIGGAPVTG